MQTGTGSGGLGYDSLFCGRALDGRPPPLARGKWYAAVWSDNAIQSGLNGAGSTALDETFGLYVTITVELPLYSFDRWREARDALEQRARQVAVMIHKDVYANAIINEANVLGEMRRGDLASGAVFPVGFVRGLVWEGNDAITEAGADWLNAAPDSDRVAIYQRLRFGGAARIQNLANAE